MHKAAIIGVLVAFLLGWSALNAAQGTPQASPTAARSYPPDKTNYHRETVPEDTRPGGKPAVGPNVVVKPQPTTAPDR